MPDLISVETALALITQNALVPGSQTIPLKEALGRTLAGPLISKVSRPPEAVSAMDGYAVRLSDVASPNATLTIIGAAPAGTPFEAPLKSGQAVRIFTGGQIPQNADHVIPQEVTATDGKTVTIANAYTQSQNVRKAGIDFVEGAQILPSGARIGPAALAVAAAANYDELTVFIQPKVALLANGDELKSPGTQLARGQIVNSNPPALAALIRAWGAEPIDLGIASDSVADIQAHIERAKTADIIVPVGGASVGDHDYMQAAFAGLGFENIFSKIAVRPGKPTWFAAKGRQRVLGLPGNPASALVCAHLFLAPLINPASGHKLSPAALGTDLPANGPRTSFLRAQASIDESGRLIATAAKNQDSSLLTPFLTANCLIARAPNTPALPAGAPIHILMIGPL